MFQIISTKINGRLISALTDDFDIKEFRISEYDDKIELNIGDIIIGRVANIVKNISSCFVEIFPGIQGYLYFTDKTRFIYANGKTGGKPVIDDLILVQILKEPTKTKSYTLTTEFTFISKYMILKPDMDSVHLSSRYKEEEDYVNIRNRFKEIGEKLLAETGVGVIIRKAAMSLDDEEIKNAFYDLYVNYIDALHRGRHGVKYERVFKEIPPYLSLIRDCHEKTEKIMTDDEETYSEYQSYIRKYFKNDEDKLKFYDDEMIRLANLYSFNSILEKCLSKKVWMNSGAYIVIEPTEALTVIDVNSGKAITGKTASCDTFMKINLEAAKEIAAQLRLRNISGMIIIDFIDIPEKYNEELMDKMSLLLKDDSTNSCVVDMTGLGLMEITRRRSGKPLYEYFK